MSVPGSSDIFRPLASEVSNVKRFDLTIARPPFATSAIFYVRTESVLVGARVAGFVNSVINGSSEVLDERAEHAAIHLTDGESGVKN
jgi:hypothetical protein